MFAEDLPTANEPIDYNVVPEWGNDPPPSSWYPSDPSFSLVKDGACVDEGYRMYCPVVSTTSNSGGCNPCDLKFSKENVATEFYLTGVLHFAYNGNKIYFYSFAGQTVDDLNDLFVPGDEMILSAGASPDPPPTGFVYPDENYRVILSSSCQDQGSRYRCPIQATVSISTGCNPCELSFATVDGTQEFYLTGIQHYAW